MTENILPWVAITYIYLETGPLNLIASLIIRTFVFTRIAHTLTFAVYPKQPYRTLAFIVEFDLIVYEALLMIFYYF
jgi:glutathione S-transferase